jgi:hypothetical protein
MDQTVQPAALEAAASTQATPPAPAPAASQAAPAGGAAVGGAAATAPGAHAHAPQPAPQPAPAAPGVRDILRGYGLDFGQAGEAEVIQHLAGVYRQAGEWQQLAQHGQQYLAHRDQFEQFLRQRQEAAEREQQARQQWWKAPEYDPTWASKLMRDPTTGELKVIPGADPSVAQKYMAWVEHQRSFLDRLAQDPVGAIRPGVEQVAREVAQQLIQQQLGGLQERTAAGSFVQQNSDWLHQRDGEGNVLYDQQTGRPALSPLGRRFAHYVVEAEQMGLGDVASQQRYALAGVQRDYLLAYARQQAGQQAGQPQDPASRQALAEQQRQQFLRQAAGARAAPAAPPPGAGVAGSPPPASGPRALAQAMLADMQAAGFGPGQQLL